MATTANGKKSVG